MYSHRLTNVVKCQILFLSAEHLCGSVLGAGQLAWVLEGVKIALGNMLPRPVVTEPGSEGL